MWKAWIQVFGAPKRHSQLHEWPMGDITPIQEMTVSGGATAVLSSAVTSLGAAYVELQADSDVVWSYGAAPTTVTGARRLPANTIVYRSYPSIGGQFVLRTAT